MGESLIIRSGGGTDTSDSNATAAQILSGYTAYVNDTKVTGTMANQGAQTATLAPGGSVTINAGWHNGSGVISTSTLAANTSANAAASQMLSGYTGWVNGSKITGSMTNQGTKTYSLAVNGSQTIPAGWHSGSGWVKQSGVSTNGGGGWTPNTATTVLCWSGWYTTGAWTVYGNGNLAAGNIKKGVAIFGVTGTFSGYVSGSKIYIVQNGSITGNMKSSIECWNPNGLTNPSTWGFSQFASWTSNGWLYIPYLGTSNYVVTNDINFYWGSLIKDTTFKIWIQCIVSRTWGNMKASFIENWINFYSSHNTDYRRFRESVFWYKEYHNLDTEYTLCTSFTTSSSGSTGSTETLCNKGSMWLQVSGSYSTNGVGVIGKIKNLWIVPG